MVISEIIVGLIAFGFGYFMGIRSVVKKLKQVQQNLKNMGGLMENVRESFDETDKSS